MASDLPMNEEQWERLLKQSDVKSARFGELMETLADHPERDAIVSREMGWTEPIPVEDDSSEDDDDDEFDPSDVADGEFEEDEFEDLEIDEIDPEEIEECLAEQAEHEAALKETEAYRAGSQWADNVRAALSDILHSADDSDSDESELVGAAFMMSQVVLAKLIGGHSLGYEEDMICGNIVCCKQALRAATEAIDALNELGSLGVLTQDLDKLTAEGKNVCRLLEQRIEELRENVWW